jgi:hypothetical protein
VSSTLVPVHPWLSKDLCHQPQCRCIRGSSLASYNNTRGGRCFLMLSKDLCHQPRCRCIRGSSLASYNNTRGGRCLDSRVPSKPFILTDVTSSTSSVLLSALVCSSRTHTFGTVEPIPPSYFKSKREYVCVMEAIRHCWEEQVGSSCNIFIETHDNSYTSRTVEISCPEYVPNALCL